MQPITNSLYNATRKASRFLQRDYLELENLQNSTRGTTEFCQRSYGRVKSTLIEELQKHTKHIYSADIQEPISEKADIVVLINPIEGMNNLGKALPFFAVSVAYLKRINGVLVPTNIIMNFPILGEVYYAEKGGGAWLERTIGNNTDRSIRLRVSACKDIDHAYIASNDLSNAALISKNQLHFGSLCYHLALFAAGKIDIIHANFLNYTLEPIYQFVIGEANGFVLSYKEQITGVNINLRDKVKI